MATESGQFSGFLSCVLRFNCRLTVVWMFLTSAKVLACAKYRRIRRMREARQIIRFRLSLSISLHSFLKNCLHFEWIWIGNLSLFFKYFSSHRFAPLFWFIEIQFFIQIRRATAINTVKLCKWKFTVRSRVLHVFFGNVWTTAARSVARTLSLSLSPTGWLASWCQGQMLIKLLILIWRQKEIGYVSSSFSLRLRWRWPKMVKCWREFRD